jgi:hypothetical protein
MLFTVEMRRKRGRWGAISCLCSRTVHVLLRQGEGQKGRKRQGQQPSHVTSGSARYIQEFSVEEADSVGERDHKAQTLLGVLSAQDVPEKETKDQLVAVLVGGRVRMGL